MKILIVTPCFYPAHIYGGPIEVSYQYGKAWVEQGMTVTVVTTNANGREVLNVKTQTPVDVAGMIVYYCKRIGHSAVSLRMPIILYSEIKKADVVVLHFVYSFPTIPTIFLCKIFNKQLLWRPHGALQVWSGTRKLKLKKWWNLLCGLLLPPKACIVFTSKTESDECRQIFTGAKTIIVPNGVTVPQEDTVKTYSERIRLLFLGRIDPIKGIENLLAAMLSVDSRRFSLDIYGQGSKEYVTQISNLIEANKLGDYVFMRGETPHDKLGEILKQTDVLVLPSYTENFGQVIVEALGHSVPVIASKGTPWEKIEEIGCGLWVENDPDSLAKAITKTVSLDLVEMGRLGREWVKKDFDWKKNAIILIKVVEGFENN